MFFYLDRIESELKRILCFWQKFVITNDSIEREVYSDGTSNPGAPSGSIFLGGVVYGASKLCRFFNIDSPLVMAQLAYNELQVDLSNYKGAYYFGKNIDDSIIHDPYRVSYAQAYIALALIEYYKTTGSCTALNELEKQIDFIESTIYDEEFGGYIDGFHENWSRHTNIKKSLATHLRILEAYTGYYRLTANKNILSKLEEIIGLIISQFFDDKKLIIYNELSRDYTNHLKSFNIGYLAETAWLVQCCAQVTRNKTLIDESVQVSVQLSDFIIETAFDPQYGGVFSELNEYLSPSETMKEWWVQTESMLALLHNFEHTGNKQVLNYAMRLYEYIDNTFSDEETGEWFDCVSREGRPDYSKPKVHFYKSLHQNIRFCLESHKCFKKLSQYSFHLAE